MRGVNKVMIIGLLGADPEVRAMPSGATVANFRVATSERIPSKEGGTREVTEWHRVAAFGRAAETARMLLRTGMQVYVEGALRTRKWQDKNGQDRWSTEIIARELLILGSAGEAADKPSEGLPEQDIPW